MTLTDVNVALLIEDEYEEMEGWYTKLRLQEAGAQVTVVGSGTKQVYHSKLGYPMTADAAADEVSASRFDAVIVPGGNAPDHMRLCRPMVDLVGDADRAGKLVASICHGGWVLASAGVAHGRRMTGYEPIRDDIVNAGGTWVDAEVVVDRNVITSRIPPDLPAFLREIVSYLESDTGKAGRQIKSANRAGQLKRPGNQASAIAR